MMIMKKLFFLLAAASVFVQMAKAQEMTLDEAIRLAQDSTIAAMEGRTTLDRAQWEYEEFLSSQRVQLSLVLDPNYRKFTFEPQLHYFRQQNYNMLNAFGELRLEKQSSSLGGQFYAGTSANWTEYFANSSNVPRVFSAVPIDVGYTNKMIGYNENKWDRQIQKFRAESEEKAYRYNLANIALKTESFFIDYFVNLSLHNVYTTNAEVFGQMYEIGKEKFEMAAISKNELSALQLQYLNAVNTLYNADQQLETARKSLLSYLNIKDNGQTLMVREPEVQHSISIAREEAIYLARENNPECRNRQEDILLAKQRVDKARVQSSFLQTAVDVSLGIQSQAQTFASAYSNITPFFYGGVTLKIPIVDGGLAKNRKQAAASELERAELSLQEKERQVLLDVENALNEFNAQQGLLERTKEVLLIADESFEMAHELYRNGEADINTFMLAQSRKDDAYMNYLNSLKTYWKSYYTLCALCVTDFRNN